MSEILLTNEATPATPGAGKTVVFANAAGKVAQVNDAGVVAVLGSGGGASYQATPADPTGTTSTTGLMMGLAGAITPVSTGRIRISIMGDVQNNTNGDGAKMGVYYGTGSAPANAAAITGTSVGSIPVALVAAANQRIPFNLIVVVTGLTLGTAYWIDLMLGAVTGGTAAAKNITINAYEY